MAESRITRSRATSLASAAFDDELADETPEAPIKPKPHPEAMPDEKPMKSYRLDLEETNANLRAKIRQDTNESNELKREIKQLREATARINDSRAESERLRLEINRMMNLLEAAKDESDQLLEENRRLSSALNATQDLQDKYSDTLKRLTVVQLEALEAREGLGRELDHRCRHEL